MSHRVLVVDDDKNMCSWIEEGLGRRKFKTTSRNSAEEAFALLATEDFDVVVTDINMPKLKGTELCERIILNHPDIPVVLITGIRKLRDGDRRDPRGRVRLPDQALQDRRAGHHARARRATARAP